MVSVFTILERRLIENCDQVVVIAKEKRYVVFVVVLCCLEPIRRFDSDGHDDDNDNAVRTGR